LVPLPLSQHTTEEHFGSYLLCGVSGYDNGNCPIVTDKIYMKTLLIEHGTLILRVVGSSSTLVAKFMYWPVDDGHLHFMGSVCPKLRWEVVRVCCHQILLMFSSSCAETVNTMRGGGVILADEECAALNTVPVSNLLLNLIT
jgi:hypothetical protein